MEKLWNTADITEINSSMKHLQIYIDSINNPEYISMARYEKARAYEILMDDTESSRNLLKLIIEEYPDSQMAIISEKRLEYLESSEINHKKQDLLVSRYEKAQDRYEDYIDTSWFLFPLKIFRWFNYAHKNFRASANQIRAKKYKMDYEARRSLFAKPVDMVFDLYKPFAECNNDIMGDILLLYSNSKSWYARWKLITEAEDSIYMKYYILKPDIFGYATLGALLMKAREGIEIKLLLDARGSWRIISGIFGSSILGKLNSFPNVTIKTYRPIRRSLLTAFIDFREIMASNHKKIIIIDKEHSIMGGRNIAYEYFISKEDNPKAWRDADIYIRSENIASQLIYMFNEQFYAPKSADIKKGIFGDLEKAEAKLLAAYYTMKSHLYDESFDPYKEKIIHISLFRHTEKFKEELKPYRSLRYYYDFDISFDLYTAPVKIMDSVSLGAYRNDITDELIKYIDGAQNEILIQNAYIVMTRRIFNALKRSGTRGVSIIIQTNSPASTDNIFTQGIFYYDWKTLKAEIPGLEIYVYAGKNSMHAKNWVFDRTISIIGTYNLDYLGEQVNSEIIAVVKSSDFAEQVRNEIISDIKISRQYILKEDKDGQIITVFGPADLPGNFFWLLRLISRLGIFRHLM